MPTIPFTSVSDNDVPTLQMSELGAVLIPVVDRPDGTSLIPVDSIANMFRAIQEAGVDSRLGLVVKFVRTTQ